MDLTRQARRLVEEIWNRGDFAFYERSYSADFLVHDSFEGKQDRDDYRVTIEALRRAFPDLHVEVLETVEGLGKALNRWRMTGTNTRPLGDRPATGRHVDIEGMTLLHFDEETGAVIEAWNAWDTLGFADQLGLVSMVSAAEIEPPPVRAERDQYVI